MTILFFPFILIFAFTGNITFFYLALATLIPILFGSLMGVGTKKIGELGKSSGGLMKSLTEGTGAWILLSLGVLLVYFIIYG